MSMRGKCSPKVTTKKGASKNQSPTIASPATGKKRKKKQLKGETGKARVISSEIHSSGSSLGKPAMKQGRFDCSSSDIMSTDQTSSSALMETGSGPTTPLIPQATPLITSSTATSTVDTRNTSCYTQLHDSVPLKMDISVTKTIPGSSPDKAVCCRRQPDHFSTDRWSAACSDEEQETRRLEVYKENRRKRYESALEQKLSQFPRNDYYSTGTR
ncbi:uncharacterized protein LOC135339546 isoform X2 [Halichondria panicea]|uniref:uncharacterized protein LOC135339546 isoform X2 n=1 Tax=Halichondria panicea TaxID=6063 RepID=UPI00312BBA39